MVDERGAALILELGLDDQCRDIPVVVDPGQGTGQVAGPLEPDILCKSAKGRGSELRGVAFVRYVENLHVADGENCPLLYRSEGARGAIRAPGWAEQ